MAGEIKMVFPTEVIEGPPGHATPEWVIVTQEEVLGPIDSKEDAVEYARSELSHKPWVVMELRMIA